MAQFPTVRWSADFGPKRRPIVRRSRRKPHEIHRVGNGGQRTDRFAKRIRTAQLPEGRGSAQARSESIEPSRRGFSARRRAWLGASKPKTGKGVPPADRTAPARPSPHRAGTPKFRPNSLATDPDQRLARIATEPFPNRGPARSGAPRPRPRSRTRGLSDSTTRPARSASNRRTIRANAITPPSCRSPAKVPQLGQFVPDPIFAEHSGHVHYVRKVLAASTMILPGATFDLLDRCLRGGLVLHD